jgi:hypothetical protein
MIALEECVSPGGGAAARTPLFSSLVDRAGDSAAPDETLPLVHGRLSDSCATDH